jgi:hypothetical protein
MSQVMRNHEARTEFWRPPLEGLHRTSADATTEMCARCNSEFVVGARYCHVCGLERNPLVPTAAKRWTETAARFFDFTSIRRSLSLNTAALVAFGLGLLCIIATVLVAILYSDVKTLADWQAIQLWRIEWLLAALAAFAAGILLKKNSGA